MTSPRAVALAWNTSPIDFLSNPTSASTIWSLAGNQQMIRTATSGS
jgi:hypothetical protein